MHSTARLALAAAVTLAACGEPFVEPSAPVARDFAPKANAGSKIAFTSDRDAPNVSTEIYVMDTDGSGERQLTETAGNSNAPEWSPNGRMIAFHSNRGGGVGESDIYVMNADGSDVTRLTNLTALGLGGAHFAAWSPDGRQVVFNSFFSGAPIREIYVINIDGTGLTNLTNHPSDDIRPAWSPDGRTIAFASNRAGNNEIFVMAADGSDGSSPTRLTTSPGQDLAPAWSPDGRRIAFQSGRDGNAEIYVMNADGSEQVRLTVNPGADAKPSWSPDGSRIAFHRDVLSFGEVHAEVFTMNADGSDVAMITSPSPRAFNGFPSWAAGHAPLPGPVAPGVAADGTVPDRARLGAGTVGGSYEITFHPSGNSAIGEGVSSAPVGTEMGVRANVRDREGNLATKGLVTFYRCERNRAPEPSTTCNTGRGKWTRYHGVRMAPSGYPPTVYGGRCVVPTIIGFRFHYDGQSSGISSGTSASRDFEWYAE